MSSATIAIDRRSVSIARARDVAQVADRRRDDVERATRGAASRQSRQGSLLLVSSGAHLVTRQSAASPISFAQVVAQPAGQALLELPHALARDAELSPSSCSVSGSSATRRWSKMASSFSLPASVSRNAGELLLEERLQLLVAP